MNTGIPNFQQKILLLSVWRTTADYMLWASQLWSNDHHRHLGQLQ